MTQRADESNHLDNENQFVLSLPFTSLVAQTVKRCQRGERGGEGRNGNLGLAGANYYIQDR